MNCCLFAIVLIVLIFLIQELIEALSQARTYRIICPYQQKTLEQYEALFKTYNMKVVCSIKPNTE